MSILEVDISSSVLDAILLVEVNKGRARGELARLLADGRVLGLAAGRVDPELGGASVEVDADGLARRSEGNGEV